MSSRIQRIFGDLKRDGRAGLMPFVTGGFPSLQATAEVLPALEQAGANIVEIGIPFSDPIADGPVISASMHEALEAGVTPRMVFQTIAEVRQQTKLGLVAMVSDSIVIRMGMDRFVTEAAHAGIDGLIVPDIDTCTAEALGDLLGSQNMTLSLLIAPTTSPKRANALVRLCSGFVYLLGRAGLTGERDAAPEIQQPVQMLRSMTDLPIAVGFGISKPEHVAAVTAAADAAIVGSALVRRMGESKEPVSAASTYVAQLAKGLRVPTG